MSPIKCAAALGLLVTVTAGNVNADDGVAVSNGASCQPSSTAGMVYTVTQIRNGSPSNRTAYCVLSPDSVESPSYDDVSIVLRNVGDVDREVNCTVKVGQPFNGGYVTVSNAVLVPAGEFAENTFADIERPDQAAVLGFNCVLPENVAVDVFGAWESSPIVVL